MPEPYWKPQDIICQTGTLIYQFSNSFLIPQATNYITRMTIAISIEAYTFLKVSENNYIYPTEYPLHYPIFTEKFRSLYFIRPKNGG